MDTQSFDQLTTADPIVRAFSGPRGSITTDDIQRLLAPAMLGSQVPEAVRSQFDLVRALCVYGYFHYRFFTLAAQLALLTLELALRHGLAVRDHTSVASLRRQGFKALLKRAKGEGLLEFHSGEDVEGWIEATTYLRNRFAHPEEPSVLTPGMAISTLVNVADVINALFEVSGHSEE